MTEYNSSEIEKITRSILTAQNTATHVQRSIWEIARTVIALERHNLRQMDIDPDTHWTNLVYLAACSYAEGLSWSQFNHRDEMLDNAITELTLYGGNSRRTKERIAFLIQAQEKLRNPTIVYATKEEGVF